MKLAINYSPPAADLVTRHAIQIDYFKCPDWPEMIDRARKLKPVTVHFTLRAGTGDLQTADWALVESLLQLTGTPYVNVHLETKADDAPFASNTVSSDTQDPAHVRQVTDLLIRDVQAVTNRFGPERVIAENVPYRGLSGPVLRPSIEPGVIRTVLEETGCGLLLDISHARITARHLGLDEAAYLETLPLERLRELHITGLHTLPNRWQDHLPMLAADWPWVDRAVENVKQGVWGPAWLLAFEYGGEGGWFEQHTKAGVIAEQVPELWQRIKGASNRG